jgi:Flp pilus assembly protein TadD
MRTRAEPAGKPEEAASKAGYVAIALLVVSIVAAYSNSFSGAFVFDDLLSIKENPTIQHLWPLADVLSPPSEGRTVGGRPVLNLSLAINYALGGLNVWGYHAFNLGIHAVAALVLFGLVRRTLRTKVGRTFSVGGGAGVEVFALAVALLWALHPLQTESVTYVVQRAESLMGLFYLLTLYCFVRSVQPSDLAPTPLFQKGRGFTLEPTPRSHVTENRELEARGRRREFLPLSPSLWTMLSVLSCLFGMATKEVMVSAPVMVLLYDRTFISGSFREALRRRWRCYLGLGLSWVLLGFLLIRFGGRGETAGLDAGIRLGDYLLTQPPAIVRYLSLCAWPRDLIFDYGFEAQWIQHPMSVLPYALVIVILAAGTVWALGKRPVVGFLGAWFFAILAPTSWVPGNRQTTSEHRMYLALIPVAVGAVWMVGRPFSRGGRGAKTIAGLAGIAVLLSLGVLTHARNAVYESPVGLMSDNLAKRPGNAFAEDDLGYVLQHADQLPEAIEHYERAVRLKPDSVRMQLNLASALRAARNYPEAIVHYEAILKIDPDYAEVHNDVGVLLSNSGRIAEAIVHFQKALEIDPDDAEAENNLGLAYDRSGKAAEAATHLKKALEMKPDDPSIETNLGLALIHLDRSAEAVGFLRKAVPGIPDSPDVHYGLALALAKSGHPAEAIADYEKALHLKPGWPEAEENLGVALASSGKVEEAIPHFREAVRLRPGYAKAAEDLRLALQLLEQSQQRRP